LKQQEVSNRILHQLLKLDQPNTKRFDNWNRKQLQKLTLSGRTNYYWKKTTTLHIAEKQWSLLRNAFDDWWRTHYDDWKG